MAAQRRLLRDLAEVQREPSELVSALPLENNLFEWHANLRPSSGPLAGIVFHVRITFPRNYPDSPPNLIFPMKEIPSFVHPNLYPFGLCLDILSSFVGSRDQHAGWSPAYSVRTLLLQLQSFLFEFDRAPQDHGGHYSCNHYTPKRIAQVRAEAAKFTCRACGHCHHRNFPFLSPTSLQVAQVAVGRDLVSKNSQDAAPRAIMQTCPAAEALARVKDLKAEAEQGLEDIFELERRTAKGVGACSVARQLLGPQAAKRLKVQVDNIATNCHVCIGICKPAGSQMLMGWSSNGKLSLGKLGSASKVKLTTSLPHVKNGDVMEICLDSRSLQFLHNAKPVEVSNLTGILIEELLADAGEVRLAVELRQATVKVLSADEEVQRLEAELQQLCLDEKELLQQKEAADAVKAAEDAAARAVAEQSRLEAEAEAAVRSWMRVRQPPQHAVLHRNSAEGRAQVVSRRLSWLRKEAEDLAKPLHEGSAGGLWASLNPNLLLKAFLHLEFSDVAPLSRSCRVWRRLARGSNLAERLQLHCFYLKTTADEDVLGYGVSVQYHDDGNLKSLSTELDPLSARAFYRHGLRRGVWGETFTHFLPLALNGEHCHKALPELERALIALACGPNSQEREFEPWMALAVVPQLMNTFVVALMSCNEDKGNVVPRHASEKALLGYCSFHHMLLALCQRHPSIAQVASQKLRAFVQGQRDKSQVPDLGQLVVYMTLSESFGWQEVMSAVVNECHIRGVLWLLRAQPQVHKLQDPQLLSSTLKHRLTSFRLLMFQAHFLRSIARPRGEAPQRSLARYHRQFGQPTELQKEELIVATRRILEVSSWPQIYRALGLPAQSSDCLAKELRQAFVRSAQLGYHGAVATREKIGVQSSLQAAFAKVDVTRRVPPSEDLKQLVATKDEVEARKVEKKLREIKQLRERVERGERLDTLQAEKIERQSALEAELRRLRR
eukprot:TRINITY_DN110144_c0_g1_i1.p1 TRINITY_DN110144_c0_g1~~TRINITY_DN110144_c0_g1_i1.p1  ORF type:complete len:962 (+),score=202.17 TRINITY_DN110144_c0_g1_i1:39-2888(+)